MGNEREPQALLDAAERVCQKLSVRLARLITAPGAQALLARTLHVTTNEFSFLSAVRAGTTSPTCLEGLNEGMQNIEPSQVRDALSAVVAGIIGLLDTFIGEDLTSGLIRDVWADAPVGPAERAAREPGE